MSSWLDPSLLDRYLAGECSAAEAAEVERWMDADPQNRQRVAAFRRAGSPPGTDVRVDVNAAWNRVAARLDEPVAAPTRPEPHPRFAARRAVLAGSWRAAFAAAAVLVLVLGGLAIWSNVSGSHGPAGLAMEVARTGPGERMTLRLPDGSEVVLGVDSRLEHATGSPGEAREVVLEGEAYFRVVHDPARPFRVHAGGAVTQVLGTEFAVHAYPDEAEVQVVVAEGRVLLQPAESSAGSGAVLGRGDVGRLTAGGVSVTQVADLEPFLAWMQGHLVLDDVTLSEAVGRLGRWYGVEFQVSDPVLARQRVTLQLRGASLEDALETLALMLDLEYERSTDRVILEARGGE